MAVLSARALAARVARLEACQRSTSAGCYLVEVPVGASDAEVEAAVATHRAATGHAGMVVITVPTLTPEEWELRYALPAGRG